MAPLPLWLICSTVAIAAAAWCFVHRILQWGKPGFRTWPLLGAAVDLLANYDRIHDWLLWNLEDLQTTTFLAPMPFHSYLVTVDHRNVEHLLKSNFSNYPKGSFFVDKFHSLLGNGIFNTDGEQWRLQRKVASFEFASRVLRDFSTVSFKEYAVKLSNVVGEFAESRTTFDVQDLFMRMTLDSICKVGFGVEVGVLSPCLPDNSFAASFDKCNEIISYRFGDPFWKLKRLFRLGGEGQLDKHVRVVDSFTRGIIRKRRALIGKAGQNHADKCCDILSRFMSLDSAMSDAELRDVVLNFVIAGRDTTAATLSWFVYMLCINPRVASKLHDELVAFDESGDSEGTIPENIQRFSELLNYDSLSKLPYLHAALMETLRLHPAVPLNFKSILQDDLLPDGSVAKRGDIIVYSPWCMGRLESLWGPDARDFRPERWCKSGKWDFNVSPFVFAAFQAGPRICLGKDSAYLQMKITAAILFRFFNFAMAPEQSNVTYRVMATMSIANGLRVLSTKV